MPGNDCGEGVSDSLSENENEFHRVATKVNDDRADNATSLIEAEQKVKWDPKDPLRPKRKKARRACNACQRAHLTCGDERPCLRCTKRGLGPLCHDGVRKKAKYLHDTPTEVLRPAMEPIFKPEQVAHYQPSDIAATIDASGSLFSPASTSRPFNMFSAQPSVGVGGDGMIFSAQTSPVSPNFHAALGERTMSISSVLGSDPMNLMLSPVNAGLFNIDLETVNFGSQYGALEWGMLSQISSGIAETSPRDLHLAQTPGTESPFGTVYGGGGGPYGQLYDGGMLDGALELSQGLYSTGNLQHGLPHAFAIANQSPSLSSPPDSTHLASPNTGDVQLEGDSPIVVSPTYGGVQSVCAVPNRAGGGTGLGLRKSALFWADEKRREPASVYETVKEPYSYLPAFHNLIAYIKRRFSSSKTLRIAKSLADIRPSLISCMKTLNQHDLVMMEIVFQRTLIEHQNFLDHNSSPAIVCRRTGEVVAVNSQFTALTGWPKNVLLGRAPGSHVHTDSQFSLSAKPATYTRAARGYAVPSMPGHSGQLAVDGRAQPVFLAELMDDDSVVEFYEDFALLAFEDSRGNRQRKGKLLKYQPAANDEPAPAAALRLGRGGKRVAPFLSNRVTRIEGDFGISKLERDGKVECTYCWCIKRDPFDIPMMIVMNFLPCYSRSHEPYQLAI